MCLAVYLASSKPLQTIAWNKTAPAFHLERVSDSEPVRKRFSVPHVYYAGSHQGCGCGFSKDGETGVDLEKCQANYAELGRTIRQAMSGGARTELFTCWEGDQGQEPESSETITPTALEALPFALKELQFLRVIDDDA